MHALLDQRSCKHLRAAVPGQHGSVEGAGEGLSFITLQHFCIRIIAAADMTADEKRAMFMEQVC